jgi:hypothetical protein
MAEQPDVICLPVAALQRIGRELHSDQQRGIVDLQGRRR